MVKLYLVHTLFRNYISILKCLNNHLLFNFGKANLLLIITLWKDLFISSFSISSILLQATKWTNYEMQWTLKCSQSKIHENF